MSNRGSRNKRNFYLKVRIQDLQSGDRVLLRNPGIPGKHKLANRWRSQPFIVCRQLPWLPVFEIRPEGSAGPVKTWHRNHLLPLTEAVRIIPEEELSSTSKVARRPVTRSQPGSLTTEDNVEKDMDISWLWSSDTPEAERSVSFQTEKIVRPSGQKLQSLYHCLNVLKSVCPPLTLRN